MPVIKPDQGGRPRCTGVLNMVFLKAYTIDNQIYKNFKGGMSL